MSKILDATCSADGMVKADGVDVPAAKVLSEGQGVSEGLLFMDGPKARYLPSSSKDIKSTLGDTITALTAASEAIAKIATTLTSIGAGMTGPTTAPPGTLPTDIIEIQLKSMEVDQAVQALNELKGSLR